MSEADGGKVADGEERETLEMLTRTRKQTEDGRQYRKQIIDKTIKRCKSQFLEQLQVVEQLLDAPTSTAILNGEGENLDKLFTNLLEAVTKGRELSEDKSDSRHDRALHDFDKQLFTMKQRIVEALQSNTGERVPA